MQVPRNWLILNLGYQRVECLDKETLLSELLGTLSSGQLTNLDTKLFFLSFYITLKSKKGLVQPASKKLKIIHTLFKVELH